MARITVKVHPSAPRTRLAGCHAGFWKLDLAAPPARGQANQACIRFFAAFAGIPQSRVRIVLGLTNRTKVVELAGIPQDALDARLAAATNT